MRVTKADGGNEEMQAPGVLGNAGAAEVKANVELVDTKQDEVVALSAAGDQTASHLDDHRGAE